MARPTLQQMRAVLDPLMSFDWYVTVPSIPGVADSREFTTRCMSATIPGRAIEALTLEAHGLKLKYAGRLSYDDTWETTLFETRDLKTRDMMVAWQEAARSWKQNRGGFKTEYAPPIIMTLMNAKSTPIRDIIFHGMFPTQLGQATMDQGTGIVTYSCTFSMDYFDEEAPQG